MRTYSSKARWAWALAILLPLAACDQGPSPEVQAQIDSLQTARDSLNRQLAERTETIEQLRGTIEEAAADVEGAGTATEPLQDRITTMAQNLRTARAELEDARGRIRVLNARASRLRDSLDTVITERDDALAMQRDSIATLVTSLDSLSSRVDELSTDQVDLSDRLTAIEEKYYTVYVAVGTQDELIEDGVIEQEGGARVLLILWKAGETPVPARDLDTENFRAIDFRETTTVDLQDSATYRLVSRHNGDYVDASVDEDGRFTAASLDITDPEQFWQASRYLIVMQED